MLVMCYDEPSGVVGQRTAQLSGLEAASDRETLMYELYNNGQCW